MESDCRREVIFMQRSCCQQWPTAIAAENSYVLQRRSGCKQWVRQNSANHVGIGRSICTAIYHRIGPIRACTPSARTSYAHRSTRSLQLPHSAEGPPRLCIPPGANAAHRDAHTASAASAQSQVTDHRGTPDTRHSAAGAAGHQVCAGNRVTVRTEDKRGVPRGGAGRGGGRWKTPALPLSAGCI